MPSIQSINMATSIGSCAAGTALLVTVVTWPKRPVEETKGNPPVAAAVASVVEQREKPVVEEVEEVKEEEPIPPEVTVRQQLGEVVMNLNQDEYCVNAFLEVNLPRVNGENHEQYNQLAVDMSGAQNFTGRFKVMMQFWHNTHPQKEQIVLRFPNNAVVVQRNGKVVNTPISIAYWMWRQEPETYLAGKLL